MRFFITIINLLVIFTSLTLANTSVFPYEQCGFDSPEEIAQFTRNPDSTQSFTSDCKAVGSGAYQTKSFTRNFPDHAQIIYASYWFYNDVFAQRKQNADTLSITFTQLGTDNNKTNRRSDWQLILNVRVGWQLRYTEADGIRRFFRLTEVPFPSGWTRLEIVKTASGQAPFIIILNGHEIIRTYEDYDYISVIRADGFPFYDEYMAMSATPRPDSPVAAQTKAGSSLQNKLSISDYGQYQKNPVATIMPELIYPTLLLSAADREFSVNLQTGRPLLEQETIVLNLLDGRANVVASSSGRPQLDKNTRRLTMLLASPPRSGLYTLETRTSTPDRAADVTRRKVEIQYLTSDYNPSDAPIRLSDLTWNFIPIGDFDAKIHPLTLQKPNSSDFDLPPLPTSLDKARKMRGEWMNFTDHYKIGKSWYAAWYHQTVTIPAEWQQRRVELLIDDPQTIATVFVNNENAGQLEWPGGYLDISKLIRFGSENELFIHVQANPLFGYYKVVKEILGERYQPSLPEWRGLSGEVLIRPRAMAAEVSHVALRPSLRQQRLNVQVNCSKLTVGEEYHLAATVLDAGLVVNPVSDFQFVAESAEQTVNIAIDWENPRLWDLSDPYLYDFQITLRDNKQILDQPWPTRFGFREIYTIGATLYLNGRPLTLFDDNLTVSLENEYVQRQEKYGFTSVYHYQGATQARILDEIGQSSGRDSAFLPISRMTVLLANSGQIDDSRFWTAAEKIIRHQVRRRENHPGVFFHYGPLGGGMAFNGGHYNPLFQNGTWYNRDGNRQQSVAMQAAGRKIYGIIKKNDPTRLVVAQDSGSLNDTMMITEYRGFQPLQEMIEIGTFWRKMSTKPFFISEQASPFQANWTDACAQGKGWNGVPCIAEWSAITLGEAVFTRNHKDELYLTKLEKEVADRRGKAKNRQELLRVRMTSDIYDVANHPLVDQITAQRIRTELFHWRADSLGLINFQYIPAIPSRTEVIKEVQAAITGFLAGTPEEKTAQTHLYRPGEHLARCAILFNNTAAAAEIKCVWTIELAGEIVDKQTVLTTVSAGSQNQVPIIYQLPANSSDLSGKLTVEFWREENFIRQDSIDFNLLADISATNITQADTAKIALIDPELDTAKQLDRLKIPYHFTLFDEDLSSYDLIIFGRRAFNYEKTLNPDGLNLGSLLRDSKKILILEQDENILRQRFGYRTEYSSSRQVFARLKNSELFANLSDQMLRNWRGYATLTDGYAVARENGLPQRGEPSGNGGCWRYIWNDNKPHNRPMKWGNTHNVATVTIIKPDTGNFRTLVDCEYGLNYAAAWELEYGRGVMVFSQLDVSGRSENDPAAERYLNNLLTYCRNFQPQPQRQLVFTPDAADKAKILNIPTPIDISYLQAGKHIVIPGTKPRVDLIKFVHDGGVVFLPGYSASQLAELDLPFTVQTKQEKRSYSDISQQQHWLLRGLDNSYFYWKGHLDIGIIDQINFKYTDASEKHEERTENGVTTISSDAGAITLLGQGIIAVVQHGCGYYVLCQITPPAFGDCELDHWLLPSQRKTEQLMSQLLNNLQAELPMPKFLESPWSNTQYQASIDLAGKWQVALGQRQNNNAPAADSSLWQEIYLPMSVQQTNPNWSGRQGRFWYKKQITLKNVSGDYRLKCAAISGEDRVWVNNTLIGATNSETDVNAVAIVPRDYAIPRHLLTTGTINILICVDYETDAVLGLNGSNGDLIFPCELQIYSQASQDREISQPISLSDKKWSAQAVSDSKVSWDNSAKIYRLTIPGSIQDQVTDWTGRKGYFRLRHDFVLSESLFDNVSDATLSPVLQIGSVDDEDEVYINGVLVGATNKLSNPSDYWKALRQYSVSMSVLKPGVNSIEIVVNDFNGSGGIFGDVSLHLVSPEELEKRQLADSFYLHQVGRADDPYWHHGF